MIRLVSVKTVKRQLVCTLAQGEAEVVAAVDSNVVGGSFVDNPGVAKELVQRVVDAINTLEGQAQEADYAAALAAAAASPGNVALEQEALEAPKKKGGKS